MIRFISFDFSQLVLSTCFISDALSHNRFKFIAENHLIVVADKCIFDVCGSCHCSLLDGFHESEHRLIALRQRTSFGQKFTCRRSLHTQIQINLHSENFRFRLRHDGLRVDGRCEFNFCDSSLASLQHTRWFGAEVLLTTKINSFRYWSVSTWLYWRLCKSHCNECQNN